MAVHLDYRPTISVVDLLEAGACYGGVLEAVIKRGGVITADTQALLADPSLTGIQMDWVIRAARSDAFGYGFGYGNGNGSGHGYGYGAGYGFGNGNGDGCGYGRGYRTGDGYGDGSAFGCGFGYGKGNGDAAG